MTREGTSKEGFWNHLRQYEKSRSPKNSIGHFDYFNWAQAQKTKKENVIEKNNQTTVKVMVDRLAAPRKVRSKTYGNGFYHSPQPRNVAVEKGNEFYHSPQPRHVRMVTEVNSNPMNPRSPKNLRVYMSNCFNANK